MTRAKYMSELLVMPILCHTLDAFEANFQKLNIPEIHPVQCAGKRYIRIPFGLMNRSATLARLVDTVLGNGELKA